MFLNTGNYLSRGKDAKKSHECLNLDTRVTVTVVNIKEHLGFFIVIHTITSFDITNNDVI